MRRILILLLALLLLMGCTADPEPTAPAIQPTVPTEPPQPWTQTAGMAWDQEGVLLEMPLTIPDGLHYSGGMPFDGDLLLWSVDSHLTDAATLELCLVELDDGSITAQRDIGLQTYGVPQILGDSIYLCDPTAGRILKLDHALQTVHQWNTTPEEGSWYMGDGEKLYVLDLDSRLTVTDLATGQRATVLEGDPEISWLTGYDGYAALEYYRTDTGAKTTAVLDFYTGQLHTPDFGEDFGSVTYLGGDWFCSRYMDGYIFYLSVDGGAVMRIPRQEDHVTLLPEGYLLEVASDSTMVRLYDLDGTLVSSAMVFGEGDGYVREEMIWNESLGGYFFQVSSYDETTRLLFWDIGKSSGGEDLTLTEVPAPDQEQANLEQRAEALGAEYGLTILIGEECDTKFDEFTAAHVTDWDRVTTAMDTLEEALATYPEGFIRQLRYDNIRGIQIQLISDLWADGSGRYGDGYAAFTQPQWDYYLMVMDIDETTTQTYFHEFSHIIDSYLAWDAGEREGALFSEEEWAQWNPAWFSGYSYDYGDQHDLNDFTCFVDSYATVSPTEDRARVMEYAMVSNGQWTFEGCDGLLNKLSYYCRCIREAFDTTGWPETVLWEQYLSLME